MRNQISALVVTVVYWALAVWHPCHGAENVQMGDSVPPMEEVLESVKANESLYSNLEAEVINEYSYNLKHPLYDLAKGLIGRRTERLIVLQNEMFYQRRVIASRFIDDQPSTSHIEECSFDGGITRAYSGHHGNIVHGRDLDNVVHFAAHSWPFEGDGIDIPLSTLLGGSPRIAGDPRGVNLGKLDIRTKVHGSESRNGQKLIRCSVDAHDQEKPEPVWRYTILLDQSRNYLPTVIQGFRRYPASQLPLTECHMVDFIEVSKGVWFPSRIVKTTFETAILHKEGRQDEMSREFLILRRVRLDPDRSKAFFSDLRFPGGTKVLELRDGETLRKFQVGESIGEVQKGESGAFRWWWIVVTGSLILGVIVGRRSRRP